MDDWIIDQIGRGRTPVVGNGERPPDFTQINADNNGRKATKSKTSINYPPLQSPQFKYFGVSSNHAKLA